MAGRRRLKTDPMSHPDETHLPFSLLQFYRTVDYPCSYLAERQARSLVAVPPNLIDSAVYSRLVRHGFRRSGLFSYRPDCANCHACIPVRIPVEHFVPDRSQQRCFKRHAHLHAVERPLIYEEAHYALYQRYQNARHAGGGMDRSTPEQYAEFMLQSHVDSCLVEFIDPGSGELRIVSLIDRLDDGLSSVYTFFDPEIAGASFGKYGILWQIARCASLGLPYLYLGYWIGQSRKMAYKADFSPLEGLIDGTWQELVTANPPKNQ